MTQWLDDYTLHALTHWPYCSFTHQITCRTRKITREVTFIDYAQNAMQALPSSLLKKYARYESTECLHIIDPVFDISSPFKNELLPDLQRIEGRKRKKRTPPIDPLL
jgi:hypothetical protein